MNRVTAAGVRQLKNSDGAYLWQPSLVAGAPAMLLGHPVVIFEDLASYTTTGALGIAFGDMAACYQIVDRMGIRVLRDPYSAKPYVEFYTTKRVGGDVIDFDAIKLLKFAT
jgi:HK97 family phage major capsid protein